MIKNGAVFKIDNDVYLSILKEDGNYSDAFNISDYNSVYKDLNKYQIQFIYVELRDGTEVVSYDKAIKNLSNIFFYIRDLELFTIMKDGNEIRIKDIIDTGDFNKVLKGFE